MKTVKRCLSLALICALTLSYMPAASFVYAGETGKNAETAVEETVDAGKEAPKTDEDSAVREQEETQAKGSQVAQTLKEKMDALTVPGSDQELLMKELHQKSQLKDNSPEATYELDRYRQNSTIKNRMAEIEAIKAEYNKLSPEDKEAIKDSWSRFAQMDVKWNFLLGKATLNSQRKVMVTELGDGTGEYRIVLELLGKKGETTGIKTSFVDTLKVYEEDVLADKDSQVMGLPRTKCIANGGGIRYVKNHFLPKVKSYIDYYILNGERVDSLPELKRKMGVGYNAGSLRGTDVIALKMKDEYGGQIMSFKVQRTLNFPNEKKCVKEDVQKLSCYKQIKDTEEFRSILKGIEDSKNLDELSVYETKAKVLNLDTQTENKAKMIETAKAGADAIAQKGSLKDYFYSKVQYDDENHTAEMTILKDGNIQELMGKKGSLVYAGFENVIKLGTIENLTVNYDGKDIIKLKDILSIDPTSEIFDGIEERLPENMKDLDGKVLTFKADGKQLGGEVTYSVKFVYEDVDANRAELIKTSKVGANDIATKGSLKEYFSNTIKYNDENNTAEMTILKDGNIQELMGKKGSLVYAGFENVIKLGTIDNLTVAYNGKDIIKLKDILSTDPTSEIFDGIEEHLPENMKDLDGKTLSFKAEGEKLGGAVTYTVKFKYVDVAANRAELIETSKVGANDIATKGSLKDYFLHSIKYDDKNNTATMTILKDGNIQELMGKKGSLVYAGFENVIKLGTIENLTVTYDGKDIIKLKNILSTDPTTEIFDGIEESLPETMKELDGKVITFKAEGEKLGGEVTYSVKFVYEDADANIAKLIETSKAGANAIAAEGSLKDYFSDTIKYDEKNNTAEMLIEKDGDVSDLIMQSGSLVYAGFENVIKLGLVNDLTVSYDGTDVVTLKNILKEEPSFEAFEGLEDKLPKVTKDFDGKKLVFKAKGDRLGNEEVVYTVTFKYDLEGAKARAKAKMLKGVEDYDKYKESPSVAAAVKAANAVVDKAQTITDAEKNGETGAEMIRRAVELAKAKDEAKAELNQYRSDETFSGEEAKKLETIRNNVGQLIDESTTAEQVEKRLEIGKYAIDGLKSDEDIQREKDKEAALAKAIEEKEAAEAAQKKAEEEAAAAKKDAEDARKESAEAKTAQEKAEAAQKVAETAQKEAEAERDAAKAAKEAALKAKEAAEAAKKVSDEKAEAAEQEAKAANAKATAAEEKAKEAEAKAAKAESEAKAAKEAEAEAKKAVDKAIAERDQALKDAADAKKKAEEAEKDAAAAREEAKNATDAKTKAEAAQKVAEAERDAANADKAQAEADKEAALKAQKAAEEAKKLSDEAAAKAKAEAEAAKTAAEQSEQKAKDAEEKAAKAEEDAKAAIAERDKALEEAEKAKKEAEEAVKKAEAEAAAAKKDAEAARKEAEEAKTAQEKAEAAQKVAEAAQKEAEAERDTANAAKEAAEEAQKVAEEAKKVSDKKAAAAEQEAKVANEKAAAAEEKAKEAEERAAKAEEEAKDLADKLLRAIKDKKIAQIDNVKLTDTEGKTAVSIKNAEEKLEELKTEAKNAVEAATTVDDAEKITVDKEPAQKLLVDTKDTGWKMIDGKKYYILESGDRLSDGWHKLDGHWYYFYDDGHLATNEKIDGWYVDNDGAWIPDDWKWNKSAGRWWYRYGDGSYPTAKDGFINIGSGTFCFDEKGYMSTGWKYSEGNWYYFSSAGYMQKDKWIWSGGKSYYLHPDGHMASDEIIDGWYVGKSGAWVKESWHNSSKGWWFGNGKGDYIRNAIVKIDGKMYIFDKNGYMQTGWVTRNGQWYHAGSSGALDTGWIKSGSKWFYMYSDGRMATNTSIDGYEIGADGAML